jgi:hypothetical protein
MPPFRLRRRSIAVRALCWRLCARPVVRRVPSSPKSTRHLNYSTYDRANRSFDSNIFVRTRLCRWTLPDFANFAFSGPRSRAPDVDGYPAADPFPCRPLPRGNCRRVIPSPFSVVRPPVVKYRTRIIDTTGTFMQQNLPVRHRFLPLAINRAAVTVADNVCWPAVRVLPRVSGDARGDYGEATAVTIASPPATRRRRKISSGGGPS